jgi:hypothetical protein
MRCRILSPCSQGYAISGERTLEGFYEQIEPWADTFMALFGRDRLPARSTLSRFLAALDQAAVESLRTLFLQDLLSRPLVQEEHPGGLWDRQGTHFLVFDVDGTREAARQRALPKTADRPAPQRRLRPLCAPGYTGRKRGEVVRTRTTVLQAHTHQWIATFGNPGNGEYRVELRRAVTAIQSYRKRAPPPRRACDCCAWMANMALVPSSPIWPASHMSCEAKTIGSLTEPRSRPVCIYQKTSSSAAPPSQLVRTLYDCPDVAIGPSGLRCRVVVATHQASTTKSRIGVTRAGVVYELFLTDLPQQAFTSADVVALYLHRGAFENALADEDLEQDPDRWCSHTARGQECWQIVSQWVWNLRLELGHQLHPDPVRTTEFAPALLATQKQAADLLAPMPGYGPTEQALPWKRDRFSGRDFAPQPDGTLRCPAGQSLVAHERRREADGSLRVVYAASIHSCRPCLLREQCQWHGTAATKPRRVSVMLHPLLIGSAPLLWKDWSRRLHRRACMQLLAGQRLEVQTEPTLSTNPIGSPAPLSRAQRAHYRLSWAERLARNARSPAAGQVMISLFGVPESFATSLGLATV